MSGSKKNVTYNSAYIRKTIKKWFARLGWVVAVAVVFALGWVAKGTTIVPPPPPPPKPHVLTASEMLKKVQTEADAMKGTISKITNPDVRLGALTAGYCLEWSTLKKVPVEFGSNPSVKQPGPDKNNVYSPLYNNAEKLYKDATDAISANLHAKNAYPAFADWVQATCITAS